MSRIHRWQPIRRFLYGLAIRFAHRFSPRRFHRGWELAALSGGEPETKLALDRTADALNRIMEEDRLSFARTRRYLERIFVIRLSGPASRYIHDVDACLLSHEYVLSDSSDDLGIGCLIINSSVRARYARRGIHPVNFAVFARIEASAIKREKYFLTKASARPELVAWANSRLEELLAGDT